MSQSTKKPWAAPKIRRFETPEEAWAYYAPNASKTELKKLEKLLKRASTDQMRRQRIETTETLPSAELLLRARLGQPEGETRASLGRMVEE